LGHMRDSLNFVVLGIGERPHDAWCHSYSAGHCHGGGTGPCHSGTKAIGNLIAAGRIRNLRSIPISYGGSLLPWPAPRGARISATPLWQKNSAASFPSWMRVSPKVVSRRLSNTLNTPFRTEILKEELSPQWNTADIRCRPGKHVSPGPLTDILKRNNIGAGWSDRAMAQVRRNDNDLVRLRAHTARARTKKGDR
jgi:hypothetical protein